MRQPHHSSITAGSLLTLCIITGLLQAGCIKTYVTCSDGGTSEGAGGCYTRAVIAGDTAQGQPCTNGNKCRFENQPNCSATNPSAKCVTVNNGGSCQCNCM